MKINANINKFNFNSKSLRTFSPEKVKLLIPKFFSTGKRNQRQNKDLKKFNTISNRTYYSSFRPKDLNLSPYKTISNKDNYEYSKINQCLSINNRYSSSLNTDFTEFSPFIKNENSKNIYSRNNLTNEISTFSLGKFKTKPENNIYKINLINTDELTQISSLLLSFKSHKKMKKKKKINFSLNNFKYNSLKYHLNKKTKLNENQIVNRYRPIIKEFFGKKDYKKFESKSAKYIRPEELITLYRDTTLIDGIFEYLNKSFMKIRYIQAKKNHKFLKELMEKKKEESKNHFLKMKKDVFLPLDKFFQIKKIMYRDSNRGLSVENKINIKSQKKIFKKSKEQIDI